MEEEASMKFFSDQNTSYADILPPHEVSFSPADSQNSRLVPWFRF